MFYYVCLKDFASIEHWSIKQEMDNARIGPHYKFLLKYLYKNAKSKVNLHEKQYNRDKERNKAGIRLKMNLNKTKSLCPQGTKIQVNRAENIQQYVYVG